MSDSAEKNTPQTFSKDTSVWSERSAYLKRGLHVWKETYFHTKDSCEMFYTIQQNGRLRFTVSCSTKSNSNLVLYESVARNSEFSIFQIFGREYFQWNLLCVSPFCLLDWLAIFKFYYITIYIIFGRLPMLILELHTWIHSSTQQQTHSSLLHFGCHFAILKAESSI